MLTGKRVFYDDTNRTIMRSAIGSKSLFIAGLITINMGSQQICPAQDLVSPALEIQLYEGAAPGSEEWDWTENTAVSGSFHPMVQNVVHPVMLYYPPDPSRSVGTAMIIAPGGGFVNLMMSYEGIDIARRLNEIGVHAFILKYRLIHIDPENPGARPDSYERGKGFLGKQAGQDIVAMSGEDGQRAVSVLRSQAAEFGVSPERIGIMGFSAGGYVTVATVLGPAESRPDFAAPIYAPTGEEWGLPITVPEDAPPLFIATAANDKIIPWECSLNLFSAWQKAGYPAEMHVFQTGRHGFVEKGGGADNFMDRLAEWLRVNGLLDKITGAE
jgi:acetyl esterase/lipase